MRPVSLPLTQALSDLDAWVACFQHAEIPVLAATSDALEAMRANEDDIDANLLGEMIAGDPLMTLKVLAYSASHRPARVITEPETVTAAIVLMGISPFFGGFGIQPSVEDRLHDMPDALAGLRQVIRRAHRAANFALGIAVHRMDHDAAVIHLAALLHGFAEMLLWCHAPTLALRIRDAQRADASLRSSTIQQEVLNIELADFQHALMQAWKLPELLVRITDERHAQQPNVKNVVLAIRLARHTSAGWDNAAIPDDVTEIGELLNLSTAATLELLHEIDA